MKEYWKTLLTVGAIATLSASTAFGQNGYFGYNGGACAPNCELPPVCEPVCDVPPAACEPTCAAPTCDVPPAPCEPTCGPTVGCEPYCAPSCGYGGFGACVPCCDLVSLVGGAINVATAPFHWAAAMLTEGIYPDCGCAPPPPKTNCDPCDMCGNFVGGCGEECETSVCGNVCGNYGGYNAYGSYGGYAANYGGYETGSYPVGAYDSEAYDASPTRQKAPAGVPSSSRVAPETLPQEAIQRGGLTQAPQYRRPSFAFSSFDVRALVGSGNNSGNRQAPSYASVEPLPPTRDARYAAQTFAPTNASPIRQVSGATQIRQSARYPQASQVVVPNVRSTQPVARQIADATPLVEERAAGRPRTFGQVRPNPATAR